MTKLTKEQTRAINGGWDRCSICNQTVKGNWWKKYKHCLKHASRCLPWGEIMALAFGIWI